jgi:endopeptidase La
VIFIATANQLEPIPPPLRDRMEVIDLPGYIEEEKLAIARKFLVPRQLAEHGLTTDHVRFTDGALRRMIADYTREAGVRSLEREIANICRKLARRVADSLPAASAAAATEAAAASTEHAPAAAPAPAGTNGAPASPPADPAPGGSPEASADQASGGTADAAGAASAPPATSAPAAAAPADGPVVITAGVLPRYLGPRQFTAGVAEERDEVGVATGVTWSPVGGDLMAVEVTLLEGKGNLILTGQLGETMRESAQAAFSYTRSRAAALSIPEDFHERTDVHIHFPSGGIPKDGPSAGITIATALVSAATRRPVRRDVAMTGEITLRGRVLPIGGVKEKVLAVHRAGIRRFILPDRNRKDLMDVPADVQRQMEFIFVDHMDAVLPVAVHGV